MTAAPRLSIGLPVFNGERYLGQSIEALLGQTFTDFELVISDNASDDATRDICRRYAKQDSRVRYVRQQANIGSTPNHNFVLAQSRGSLFKWAAADDLYARDLLQSCVTALDEQPRVVLAHCWTAAIDGDGNLTQALEYPLATNSASAPARFASMLFGSHDDYGVIRADDQYGVMRADVLRRAGPHHSYYHADRVLMTKVALYGPFHQIPDWKYFRRDHAGRANNAPSLRTWCSTLDPRRASRFRHPAARLLAEYLWGYADGIRRAPLSAAERRQCFRYLALWAADRAGPAIGRAFRGGVLAGEPAAVPPPVLSARAVDALVAGQQERAL